MKKHKFKYYYKHKAYKLTLTQLETAQNIEMSLIRKS